MLCFQVIMEMFVNVHEEHVMIWGILDHLDAVFMQSHNYVLCCECGKDFLQLDMPVAQLSADEKAAINCADLLQCLLLYMM